MTTIIFLKARDRGDTGTGDMFAPLPGTHVETHTRKDGVVQKYHVAAPAPTHSAPHVAPDDIPAGHSRKFYVTMIRDKRMARLAGPFDRHEDALAHVEPARKLANQVDPFSEFDAFGTAGVTAAEHRTGTLNQHLGIGAPKPARPQPLEESAEDISHREWRENYDRVVNGDLASFSDKDILRAIGYANRVQVAHQPKAWDGDAGAKNMIDTMRREEQYLEAELKRREKSAPAPDPTVKPGDDLPEAAKQAKNGTMKASDVSFGHIKSLIGSSLAAHEWDVDNGGKVKAQVKVTIRAGQVKTAYLHATIIQPNGKWEYYREHANGKFKLVTGGGDTPPLAKSFVFIRRPAQ